MVANSQACSTPEMQTFLSTQTIYLPKMDATDAVASKRLVDLLPSQGTFRTLYKSVAIGFDELLAGPTLVEAVATRLSQQAAELAGLAPTNVTEEDMKGLSNSDVALGTSSEGLTYFTAPICDLLVELFELKARNNWLRRQAILVILQTVLGGTIERCVNSCQPLQFSRDLQQNARWGQGSAGKPESGHLCRYIEECHFSEWSDATSVGTKNGRTEGSDKSSCPPPSWHHASR